MCIAKIAEGPIQTFGELDLGFGRVNRGREGIIRQMSTQLAVVYTHTSHHLSNIQIDFDGRDRARARSRPIMAGRPTAAPWSSGYCVGRRRI